MFIHLVLFKIKRKNVPAYVADCKLWEKEAARQTGFIGYHTFFRTNERGHYASFYIWKDEKYHKRFMSRHHDRLVGLSKCPVEVVGYYNFKSNGKPSF